MVALSAHERKTPGRRDHLVPARPRGHDPAGRAAWARPGAAPAAGAGRRRVDRVRLRGVAAAKGHAEARGRADPRRRHRAPGGRDDRAAAEQQRFLPVHLGRQGAGGGHRPLPVRAGGRRGRPAAQRLPVVGHRARALRGLPAGESHQHDRPGGQPGGGLLEAEPDQGAHGVPAGGRGLLPRRAARRARGRLCHPHPGRGGRLRHARHGDSPARAAQAREGSEARRALGLVSHCHPRVRAERARRRRRGRVDAGRVAVAGEGQNRGQNRARRGPARAGDRHQGDARPGGSGRAAPRLVADLGVRRRGDLAGLHAARAGGRPQDHRFLSWLPAPGGVLDGKRLQRHRAVRARQGGHRRGCGYPGRDRGGDLPVLRPGPAVARRRADDLRCPRRVHAGLPVVRDPACDAGRARRPPGVAGDRGRWLPREQREPPPRRHSHHPHPAVGVRRRRRRRVCLRPGPVRARAPRRWPRPGRPRRGAPAARSGPRRDGRR